MALPNNKPDDDQPQFLDDDVADNRTPDEPCPVCNDDGPGSQVTAGQECPACGKMSSRIDSDTVLAYLGQALFSKFDDCEQKRTYIEDRWLEDLRQFHGRYDPHVESELRAAEGCTLFLNITKPKTHAFSARVMDMLLPTNDRNWTLEPRPVPEVAGIDTGYAKMQPADVATLQPAGGWVDQSADQGLLSAAQPPAPPGPPAGAGQPPAPPGPPGAPPGPPGAAQPPVAPPAAPAPPTGQPMTTPQGNLVLNVDLVKAVEQEAKARCDAMADVIEGQLDDNHYDAAERQAIEQMAKLGTGIVMGPVILDEWKVAWVPVTDPRTGQTNFERRKVPNKTKDPGVQWIDCWNFYPDMSAATPDEWGFVFVQYLVNDATFRKMGARFNWMPKAMEQALKMEPFNVRTLRWMNELRDLSETNNTIDNRHRVMRFYGEIEPEELEAAGIDPKVLGIKEGDPVHAVVWLCDRIVLKVDINPLDSGDMPFSVCYCDKDESSPFGRGIPRLMRGEQESVNAAWRMKHDNAGLSVCPQTVIRLNAITPADGDYHLKPKKVWYASDDTPNVNNVFAQFAVDSHQEELDNILQLGIRFADDVTQTPLIMQGDQAPGVASTAQGMSLLYNASTVVLRRAVKLYDDFVTVPMIERMYQWNMQFNPRTDIKGDFKPVARGSSSLLDKEQQGQALDMAMQFASSPVWQPYTDMKKLYREALKAKHIPDIMASDEDIAKALQAQQELAMAQAKAGVKPPPPPDPLGEAKLQVAQEANQLKAQDIAQKAQIADAASQSKERVAQIAADARVAAVKVKEDAANQRAGAESAANAREASPL